MGPKDFKNQLLAKFTEAGVDVSTDNQFVRLIVEPIFEAYKRAYEQHFSKLEWLSNLKSEVYEPFIQAILLGKARAKAVCQVRLEVLQDVFALDMISEYFDAENLEIYIDSYKCDFDAFTVQKGERFVDISCVIEDFFNSQIVPTSQSIVTLAGRKAGFFSQGFVVSVSSVGVIYEQDVEKLLERLAGFGSMSAEQLAQQLKDATKLDVVVVPFHSPWNFTGV